MGDKRIDIYMGDFAKNAGIVGLWYLLDTAKAREGSDYGKGEDGQHIWLDQDFAMSLDWTKLYFRACIKCFEKSTVYTDVMNKIEFLLEQFEENSAEKDTGLGKKIKEDLKFINDKLLANSYKSGFSNIQNEIEMPEVYIELEKNKLNEKAGIKVLKKRLESLQKFLKQPLVRETFVMKSVIYRYINKFWEGKSFLLMANAKKDIREVFENDFVNPMKEFWSAGHEKAKDTCIDCGKSVNTKEKVSIAFMADTADDLVRKRSSFWGFEVDAYLCPECAFIYALVPLGFSLASNKFVFINTADHIDTLLKNNDHDNKLMMDARVEIGEKKSAWYARVMNLILGKTDLILNNIQVIVKSSIESKKYEFKIINKEVVKIVTDHHVRKKLELLAKNPYYKVNTEFINVYEDVIDNIFNYRNQYGLVNALLRNSLKSESAVLMYPAALAYEVEVNSKIVRNGGNYNTDMRNDAYKMMLKGRELRSILEPKTKGDFDESIRGTVYQLLNTLSVRNSRRFLDIVIRLYCSCQSPIPSGFTKMLESSEDFQTYGYAFVLGLKNNYNPDKKQDSNTDSDNKEA